MGVGGRRQEEALNPWCLCSGSHTSEARLKPCDRFLWKRKDICRHLSASWLPERGWRHGDGHPGTGWERTRRVPRSARRIPPSPRRTPAFLSPLPSPSPPPTKIKSSLLLQKDYFLRRPSPPRLCAKDNRLLCQCCWHQPCIIQEAAFPFGGGKLAWIVRFSFYC